MRKIIIIGAGPAGLTAALELQKAEEQFEIIILEETEQIGGISQTVSYHGNRMDIGGHRFFSKDSRVMDCWFDLMPLQGENSIDDAILGRKKTLSPSGPNPEQEDQVMLLRHRVSRIFYRKKFFDYPISMKWQTIRNMGFFTTMKAGFSYLKTIFVKLKETSLENFYINRFGKVLYSMFFEGYTEKLWGRHPSEISADWGAQRVKGLSILAVLKDMFSRLLPSRKNRKVETSLIEEFYYPKLGPGQLWETAADRAVKQGASLLKNAKVVKILSDENHKITSVVYEDTNGGQKTLEGDIFLSSMPVKDLVAGMNQVPSDMAAIAAGLPYRDFVTVGLLIDHLDLINETEIPTLGNIVPDCWIYVQDTGVKLGRIQIFNNWSPYMVQNPEHSIWIGLEYFCNEGDAFWNMSDDECIEMAKEELITMGVISDKSVCKDAHRVKIKKAYPAYFDTYDQIDKLTAWLDTHENLYCIGRNGQHRYNNMDHSMVTAMEAAQNIIHNVTDKSNIWSVNTDQEYHEEKSE